MHCKRCATLEAELEFPEPSTPHVDFLSQEGFRRKIKAGPGPRFHNPKPLPTCARPVQPRFRSLFQLDPSGRVASSSASKGLASVVASAPSFAASAKPLPAYLPLQHTRSAPSKGAPVPRPRPRKASFYAKYPCDAEDSGIAVPSSSPKAPSFASVKPCADILVAPASSLQPPMPKAGSGFVSSKHLHQERSSVVLGLFLQLCAILQPLSKVLSGLQGSLHGTEFQARLLHKVADTTASRYLRSALLFIQTVDDLGGSILSLFDALAADAIFVLHRAGEGCLGHPSNVLKAVPTQGWPAPASRASSSE